MAVLLWEGKSPINGQDIGVLATLDSDNTKTGRSVQIWILLRDYAPHEAQKSHRDEAVCGFCSQRPAMGGKCYVVTAQAPNSVWRAWRDGRCENATIEQIRNIAKAHGLLRFGAYGDPAMMPLWLLEKLALDMPITGYTHQWSYDWAQPFRQYLMASVENESQARHVVSKGWRYFRSTKNSDRMIGEVVCPASDEGGNKLQCRQCKACDGMSRNLKSNIVIQEH